MHRRSLSEDRQVGLLVRVVVTYAAWLTAILVEVPGFIWTVIVVAAPLLFGGVIWHLRKSHTRSAINRLAFCGALALFPLALVWLVAGGVGGLTACAYPVLLGSSRQTACQERLRTYMADP